MTFACRYAPKRGRKKVPDDVRLAIWLRGRAGESVKVLECDYGLSRATARDCMNNETRARAILAARKERK